VILLTRRFCNVVLIAALMLPLAACTPPLIRAVDDGNLQKVRELLDKDEGANLTNQDKADALVEAALKGQMEIVRLLLDQGVDPNGQDKAGIPALFWAAFWDYPDMVRLLLERGADGKSGNTLLMVAEHGHLDIVRFLVDKGADVNQKLADGTTPLIRAAANNHPKVVRFLLERGADPEATTKEGKTAAMIAESKGYPALAAIFQEAEAKAMGISRPGAAPAATEPAIFASDVDRPPSLKVKPKPNAYAIVVGIESYRNQLPKADFANRDAQVMGEYLTKMMGYQEENVVMLLNDRAAKTDIEKYVEKWLPNRAEKDASVFIYYSGHGAPNPKTGDVYLVPYDGDPAFVDETGYPLKRLYERVNKLPAKEVVVMLDSCFSGAGGRSVIGKGMRPMVLSIENPVLVGGKTAVLAASQGDQVSSTYNQKGHGLLTYFFLKGLQGEADKNKDGAVDLVELFEYVKPQVERTARRDFNNEQTPQLLGNPDLLAKGVRLVERATP